MSRGAYRLRAALVATLGVALPAVLGGCAGSEPAKDVTSSATVSLSPVTTTLSPTTTTLSPTTTTLSPVTTSLSPVTTSLSPTTATLSPTEGLEVGRAVPLPDIGTEASGLARSDTIDGAFWTIDDATGTDTIVAVDTKGRTRASVTVEGMSADNAEALAAAPCTGTKDAGDVIGAARGDRCLFVGDIGDNAERREAIAVYALPEPAANDTTAAAQRWDYTYPDGPHNAESLLVATHQVVVITKPDGGTAKHRIYAGPRGGGALRLIDTFRPPAPPDPLQSMVTGVVVTDAEWDGRRVLLLTYDDVIAYTAPETAAIADLGSAPAGFASWPSEHLPFPDLPQAEGIASLADGCGYAVASEDGPFGTASSLAVVRCR